MNVLRFNTSLILFAFLAGCSMFGSSSTPAPLVLAKVDATNEADAWRVLSKGRIKRGNWKMGQYTTMFIEATGDDQEYVFYMKDPSAKANNYRYEKEFRVPAGEEQVIKLKFAEFKAYQKGVDYQDAAPLNLDEVVEVGIRVKDLKNQDYTLAVNSFWAEQD